jgi:transposase
MIRRAILLLAAVMLIMSAGLNMAPRAAFANKVDCAKVMSEKAAGKKTKDIASDLKISTSSVYRCKQKAGAKGKMTPTPAASATPRK